MKKLIVLQVFMLLFMVYLLTSCKKSWTREIEGGIWLVDSINFKGNDIKHCLMVNAVSFKNDKTVHLPGVNWGLCSKIYEPEETGFFKTSEIGKDSAVIIFTSNNRIFKGKHLLLKREVPNQVQIRSDSLFVVLVRIL
jgi:hypothetical protein